MIEGIGILFLLLALLVMVLWFIVRPPIYLLRAFYMSLIFFIKSKDRKNPMCERCMLEPKESIRYWNTFYSLGSSRCCEASLCVPKKKIWKYFLLCTWQKIKKT